MRRILIYIMLIAAVMIVSSCQRRPLHEFQSGCVFVDIELEIEQDVPTQRSVLPSLFAVAFYDIDTHALVSVGYVPLEGGYVMVNPGKYDVLVYNSDTEYSQIRQQNNIDNIEVFTSEISGRVSQTYYRAVQLITNYMGPDETRAYEDCPLIYEPDHVYVHAEHSFDVPHTYGEKNAKTLYAKPKSLNERFTATIGPVYNGEFVQSSEVFLAGMGSAKRLHDREISGGPATIWFSIGIKEDRSQFYTPFNAFGCYFPDKGNPVSLLLRIVDVTGNEYYREWDVSDQVKNGGHDIVIYDPITITPTPHETGAPTISLWDEIVTNIDIY